MAEQISVVLVDSGDDIGTVGGNQTTGPMGPSAPPQVSVDGPRWKGTPDDSPSGGKGKQPSGPTAGQSAVDLMAVLTRQAGGGKIVDAGAQLARVFNDITKSATNIGRQLSAPAPSPSAPSIAPGPSTMPVTAPAPAAQPAISPPASPATSVNLPTPSISAPGRPSAPIAGPRGIPVPAPSAITGPAASGANSAASGLASLARFAGPAGIAIAGVATAAAAGAMVIKGVFDSLANEAKRLEGYSGELSVAMSMNDVRAEMNDLRRAQRIGPDLARFENARGKLNDASAKVLDEIYALLAKIAAGLVPVVERIAMGIDVVAAGTDVTADNITAIWDFLNGGGFDKEGHIKAISESSLRLTKASLQFFAGQADKEEDVEDPFMTMLLSQFAGGARI